MDFFQHQDRARRNTSLLVGYFILAVALIIAAVYAVFVGLFLWLGAEQQWPGAWAAAARRLWHPDLFLGVSGGTLGIVVLGTLYKVASLARGGEAVARMLDAQPVGAQTGDPSERKLLNVVEEMAIASGTPVPRVFVLNDDAINAFAAGFSTRDAIIGVTRGCIRKLTRDELQGVIGHEFSHILNGDMRLNIRLIGILHGILVIGIIGYWLFRVAARSSSRVSRKKGGNTLPFILLGLGVMAVGYIGVFFGRLIQSAVSRQREFLADASAVQFTRNPAGIASALKKIAGLGSRLDHPRAQEACHLFFANGLHAAFFNLMATHPPLPERIRRLDPSFDGNTPARLAEVGPEPETATPALSRLAPSVAPTPLTAKPAIPLRLRRDTVLASVGRPQPEHLAYAAALLAGLPDTVKTAAHDVSGAQALLFGLLLAPEAEARDQQLRWLAMRLPADQYRATLDLSAALGALPLAAHLPLVDMALGALRELPATAYPLLKDALQTLAEADARITLFEYMLLRLVVRQLDPKRRRAESMRHSVWKPIIGQAVTVLSTLAYYGRPDAAGAQQAFAAGVARLGAHGPLTLAPPAQCGLQQVDDALRHLADAFPILKKQFLDACLACIAADNRTTQTEAELLRAIAAELACPIPPILPDTGNPIESTTPNIERQP